MKILIFAISLFTFSFSATAQQRVSGINGDIYLLQSDGSYKKLASDSPAGSISFKISRTTNLRNKCRVEATLTNQTKHSVQYLKQCFKLLSPRGGSTTCFTFGGGHSSSQIGPGKASLAEATFSRARCEDITGAEPYFLFGGRDPSDINVVGVPPFSARSLFHYSKNGVLPITNR